MSINEFGFGKDTSSAGKTPFFPIYYCTGGEWCLVFSLSWSCWPYRSFGILLSFFFCNWQNIRPNKKSKIVLMGAILCWIMNRIFISLHAIKANKKKKVVLFA